MRSLLLIALLSLGGVACTSPQGSSVAHHEDRPLCMDEAVRIEDQAQKEVRNGHRRVKVEKKAEHYDRAIELLRAARNLYEAELLSGKGTPERDRNIKAELERLEDEIFRLQVDRPQ